MAARGKLANLAEPWPRADWRRMTHCDLDTGRMRCQRPNGRLLTAGGPRPATDDRVAVKRRVGAAKKNKIPEKAIEHGASSPARTLRRRGFGRRQRQLRVQCKKKKVASCGSKKLLGTGDDGCRSLHLHPAWKFRVWARPRFLPQQSTRGNLVNYPPNRRDCLWLATSSCGALEPQRHLEQSSVGTKLMDHVGKSQECSYCI